MTERLLLFFYGNFGLPFFYGGAMKTSFSGIPYSLTKKRLFTVSIAFSLLLTLLFINLFRISYIQYDYYRQKAFEEVTTTSKIRGNRGIIYDRNMNVLATNKTSYRIFLSTREIRSAKKTRSDVVAVLAKGLSEILSVDEAQLTKKMTNKRILDVTVIKNADEEQTKQVLAFAEENGLTDVICTEGTSERYYPGGTLAAHVLGFCGSDGQGLYGLEYEYDKELAGKFGFYLYAKDAKGNVLPSGYETYVPAEDGYSIVTTLDSHVQEVLETQLETIRVTHGVNNRVTGIVMDVKSGGILGMAVSSPFDPNEPYVLDSVSAVKLDAMGLSADSDEYKAAKKNLLEVMWSNKAVSETYEPGSTFKIVTVSTALDLGVAKVSDTFSCHGYYEVGGWRIKCHKVTGHGSGFNLAYGLQQSCNPTMMQLSERIGSSAFYDYVEKFGYFEKTGIDLPSEAETIFHKLEKMGSTELATASFGQRFKVSVISQLTAVAAVANGGVQVTPHLMEKILDKDGNSVSEYRSPQNSRVISEEVAKLVSEILEAGVSGTGGAKNAYVDGYKVAAKTGTSQKFDVLDANGNSYLRIGSTVAYAPSDQGGVAIIIVVDEPTGAVKYGSFVAAPYVSAVLTDILPYLGYESTNARENTEMPNLVGSTAESAKKRLSELGMDCQIVGDGDVVLSQIPSAGQTVTSKLTSGILYTVSPPEDFATVPKLIGLSPSEANLAATNAGLSVCLSGVSVSAVGNSYVKVVSQSLAEGSVVPRGTTIVFHCYSLSDEE